MIPCFRDGHRLEGFLRPLAGALARAEIGVLIRVVDDGSGPDSSPATAAAVSRVAVDFPNVLPALLLPANSGKGGAVYAGWDEGPEASWLAFADADGATPPGEVARLLSLLPPPGEPPDALLASRVKMLGRQVDRTVRRHVFGRVYATLAAELTGVDVYDSQCGCKVVRGDFYRRVRASLTERRFGFDMDLIAHLEEAGAVLWEVPVDWRDVGGSKVRLLRDGSRMLVALWQLRCALRHRRAVASAGPVRRTGEEELSA